MQHRPLLSAPLRRRSALIPLLLLAGCGPVVSYADVVQTAQAGGCWPNRPAYPTPPPATITPALPLTPTPLGYRWPAGAPSPTPPPTTTPFPRCPPAPGEALAPWPTAVPPPPPYPTMAEDRAGGGSGQKNTLRLPEVVLAVDPATRTWTPAHQVDVGPAGLGRYTRTVEVAVSGDGVVHAVWGMSDPDFRDNDPPAGVWAAESRDFGVSWGQPRRIGADCRQVVDVAATTDGWIVAGLGCHDGPSRVQPAIALRSPAGEWSLERLPGSIWHFTEGAIAIANDGGSQRATVLFLTGPDAAMATPPRALSFAKALGTGEPWRPHVHQLDVPGVEEGPRLWHARSVVYRPRGAAVDSVTLLFSDASRWAAYALTSQDGGRSWLPPELVAAPELSGERIAFAGPAYDPAGERLAAIYTCCVEGGWNNQEPNTHFLRWSAPGSGSWHDPTPGQRVPLVLGARAAGDLATAQARNAGTVWVAWVEGGGAVEVRAFDLASALPPVGR